VGRARRAADCGKDIARVVAPGVRVCLGNDEAGRVRTGRGAALVIGRSSPDRGTIPALVTGLMYSRHVPLASTSTCSLGGRTDHVFPLGSAGRGPKVAKQREVCLRNRTSNTCLDNCWLALCVSLSNVQVV